MGEVGRLMLLRHGESTLNAQDRFTGLLDVPLTSLGEQEANVAARLLLRADFSPDTVFTSVLQRARRTAAIVLADLGEFDVTQIEAWELNERNYGALTGRTKSDVLNEYGREQFTTWRRSLMGQPPPLDANALQNLRLQPALFGLPAEALTPTESLADVVARVSDSWRSLISVQLRAGKDALIVAHGNSLRALCFILDELTAAEVQELNLPTGQPLSYELDPDLRPRHRGGQYLDPAAAHEAALAIARSGGT